MKKQKSRAETLWVVVSQASGFRPWDSMVALSWLLGLLGGGWSTLLCASRTRAEARQVRDRLNIVYPHFKCIVQRFRRIR